MSKVNKEIVRKLQNTTRALVKKYGEGAIVTQQQVASVIKSLKAKKTKTIHLTYYTCNPSYKKGRNQYLVTSDLALDAWNRRWAEQAAKKAAKAE